MPDEWISIQEAAKYAHVSEKTIRRYLAAGVLTKARFGPRLIRIRRDSLEAALGVTA